jgi:hypothetical protein
VRSLCSRSCVPLYRPRGRAGVPAGGASWPLDACRLRGGAVAWRGWRRACEESLTAWINKYGPRGGLVAAGRWTRVRAGGPVVACQPPPIRPLCSLSHVAGCGPVAACHPVSASLANWLLCPLFAHRMTKPLPRSWPPSSPSCTIFHFRFFPTSYLLASSSYWPVTTSSVVEDVVCVHIMPSVLK